MPSYKYNDKTYTFTSNQVRYIIISISGAEWAHTNRIANILDVPWQVVDLIWNGQECEPEPASKGPVKSKCTHVTCHQCGIGWGY